MALDIRTGQEATTAERVAILVACLAALFLFFGPVGDTTRDILSYTLSVGGLIVIVFAFAFDRSRPLALIGVLLAVLGLAAEGADPLAELTESDNGGVILGVVGFSLWAVALFAGVAIIAFGRYVQWEKKRKDGKEAAAAATRGAESGTAGEKEPPL